jgi:C-5 cytosine-specific DNA methylase
VRQRNYSFGLRHRLRLVKNMKGDSGRLGRCQGGNSCRGPRTGRVWCWSMRKVVSLFAGAGGLFEGVRLAGFKVLCAVENDEATCRTHAANFKNVALFEGDISGFLRDERDGIPSRRELIQTGIDPVYGGPPCQGFSQIGPRRPDDPRNKVCTLSSYLSCAN